MFDLELMTLEKGKCGNKTPFLTKSAARGEGVLFRRITVRQSSEKPSNSRVREWILQTPDAWYKKKWRFSKVNRLLYSWAFKSKQDYLSMFLNSNLNCESCSVFLHLHWTFVTRFFPKGRILPPFLHENEHFFSVNLPARFKVQSMLKSEIRDLSIDSRVQHVEHDHRPLDDQE